MPHSFGALLPVTCASSPCSRIYAGSAARSVRDATDRMRNGLASFATC